MVRGSGVDDGESGADAPRLVGVDDAGGAGADGSVVFAVEDETEEAFGAVGVATMLLGAEGWAVAPVGTDR